MVAISYTEAVRVSPLVRRITAANSGVMTGPGTNTYIVGEHELAVIDPGPALPAHIDSILRICGDRLRWILATHTHPDHSPAAHALAEATGAIVMGNVLATNDGFQDKTFTPQQHFEHDGCLQTVEFTVRAIHTPGHVDNHLCYLVEEDGLLLTGDHIMQGSTVVIIPPYGDMQAYIRSLQLLLAYPMQALGPGHGTLIENPKAEIERLVKHRLAREAKVVEKLNTLGPMSLVNLTPAVYDDVDVSLHPIAQYSLLAHLLKLQKEGLVRENCEQWTLI